MPAFVVLAKGRVLVFRAGAEDLEARDVPLAAFADGREAVRLLDEMRKAVYRIKRRPGRKVPNTPS